MNADTTDTRKSTGRRRLGNDSHVARLQNRTAFSYINNLGPSPFPPLEAFINTHLAVRKGVNGAVRAWTVESSSSEDLTKGVIIYQIKENRWCENIQRCHKSNNVMWNISLSDMKYWQTCHDPECRMMSFRGEVKELPKDVQNAIKNICLDKAVEVDSDFESAISSLDIPERGESMKKKTVDESFDNDEFGAALAETLMSDPDLYP